ncbi:amidohydrolase family protein [Agromyces sp. CFH 90414]|uniref:Amidohydrolase family protein n=1 Tax=Agromyces agglutinans TaxID=2662258 RepID=A0A6I2F6P7_9MICO|nr:amidohydrolase family protein [Agromyces agglutinans]MRG60289.1 amidohydrolase family protein [Agromyces agglutinans]
MTGFIDAHVHLWDVDRMHLSWFRADLGLPRAATLDALRAAARDVGGRGAIAVQAADTLGEADWLTGLAAREPFLRAVVLQYDARTDASAWAGMAQPLIDRTGADGGRAGARPGRTARIAGIRLATPGGAADFGDVAGLDRLADGLARTGRVLELLIRPEQLPAAAALAARHPALTIVACHLAIGGDAVDARWLDGLHAFAAQPNAVAKASGLVRHAPEPDRERDDARVRDILSHAVGALGADRLMFGSDWPISARFATYAEVVRRTTLALPELDEAGLTEFWSGTARRCYAPAAAG